MQDPLATNAEASGSRPRDPSTSRSVSRTGPSSPLPGSTTPSTPSRVQSPTSATGGNVAKRKVRTVPPSAKFEPPTPPTESAPTFDTAARGGVVPLPPNQAKRKKRIAYDSSDYSGSADDESDDDEPPWWTFTQNGINRIRARVERSTKPQQHHRQNSGDPDSAANITEAESGREGVASALADRRRKLRKKERALRLPQRISPARPEAGDAPQPARQDSGGSTPGATRAAAARLFHPRPSRVATPEVIRRSSDGPAIAPSASLGLLTVQPPPPVQRSNSAPIQPGTEPSPAVLSLVTGLPEGRRTASPEPQSGAGSDSGNGISPGRRNSRMNSFGLPSFPRRSTEGAPDILTDPESTIYTTPRNKSSRQQRLFGRRGLTQMPEETNGFESESGVAGSGPTTPLYKRRPGGISDNLRLRLPPPMREHFANGWPHAGSWQDALRYGVYDDEFGTTPGGGGVNGAINRGNSGSTLSRSQSAGAVATMAMNGNGDHSTDTSAGEAPQLPRTPGSRGVVVRTPGSKGVTVRTPSVERVSPLATVEEPEKAKRKSGRRKTRRYRPVLVPPTPGGNLLPREKVPGSTWGTNVSTAGSREQDNPFERTNPFERIDEELSLSPQPTHSSEKPKRVRNNCTLVRALWSFFFNPRQRRAPAPVDDLDFQAKLRRILFLDARVTIYIRLFNLGVVATLLGLAVTIRREQNRIGAPGSIGPSTTLIIAYSSFTMVHVLLAIYREYFGRPIGLWGLRSKMLWVCLDLLFVALWSSATTLAINDYIDTPLNCSPLAPWWTNIRNDSDIAASFPRRAASSLVITFPDSVRDSQMAADVCRRQAGVLTICLVALLLYCGNMVLSLFRIFETVRRTANPERTVSV